MSGPTCERCGRSDFASTAALTNHVRNCDPERNRAMREAYEGGQPLRQVAETFRVSVTIASKRIRAAGGTIKPRGGKPVSLSTRPGSGGGRHVPEHWWHLRRHGQFAGRCRVCAQPGPEHDDGDPACVPVRITRAS